MKNSNLSLKLAFAAGLAVVLPATLLAGTFSDDFSTGLNPTYWTITQTTPGVYSEDHTQGDVRLAKIASTSGLQDIAINLNMSAVGGPIAGDFSMQIDFLNAIIGPGVDQVEFHAFFGDSSFFFDVRDNSSGQNVHVWNGSINGFTATTATSGTFSIVRTGSSLTGYFNGSPIFSESNTSSLIGIAFILQNQPSGANDTPSVTFDNFSLTANSVPEPTTWAMVMGGIAMFLCVQCVRWRTPKSARK